MLQLYSVQYGGRYNVPVKEFSGQPGSNADKNKMKNYSESLTTKRSSWHLALYIYGGTWIMWSTVIESFLEWTS